jgi:hypothetical protein
MPPRHTSTVQPPSEVVKKKLSADTLANLYASGLSDETILEEGWYEEWNAVKLAEMLNQLPPHPPKQIPQHLLSGGLVLSFVDLNENDGFHRVRPFHPRIRKGRPVKYEQPVGEPPRAYFSKRSRPLLRGGKSDVHVTEGEKKAALLGQLGFAAIGLCGIWCFKESKKSGLISDLESVSWKGRRVFIVFDYESNAKTARQVMLAARRLTTELRQLGAADVLFVVVPAPTHRGDKNGIDDYLVSRAIKADIAYRELLESAESIQGRTLVQLGTDEFRINEECEAHLCEMEELYQRGGNLAEIIRHVPKTKEIVRRSSGAPIVRNLPLPILRERLTRLVECVRADIHGNLVAARLPNHVVSTIHCRGTWTDVAELNGLVNHPTLLPDGSILAEPGYDRDTGLFLSMPDILRLSVPDRPTQQQAKQAYYSLCDLVQDFPFKDEAHEAAYISAFVTPLTRFAYDAPAPFFLVDGNMPGVGKGLLLDVIFLTMTGRKAAVASYTNDREELRKAITSTAVAGDEMVQLDNLSGPVGSDVFDRALTATWWEDRILGGNNKYNGPLLVTWFATGNNPILIKDTPRRTLPIRLETTLERPEERQDFACSDLRTYVSDHRGELLSAGLTILRAYVVAGRPDMKLKAWGSFEEWSKLVRAAIKYAAGVDPIGAREEIRETSDPVMIALGSLLHGMAALAEAKKNPLGYTAKELMDDIHRTSSVPEVRGIPEAIAHLCPVRYDERLTPAVLGNKLAHYKDRIIDGYKLVRGDKVKGGYRWRSVHLVQPMHPSRPYEFTKKTSPNISTNVARSSTAKMESAEKGASAAQDAPGIADTEQKPSMWQTIKEMVGDEYKLAT